MLEHIVSVAHLLTSLPGPRAYMWGVLLLRCHQYGGVCSTTCRAVLSIMFVHSGDSYHNTNDVTNVDLYNPSTLNGNCVIR